MDKLSGITSSVLTYQAKDKFTGNVLSKDIKGKNSIDANSDNTVTVEELLQSAKNSGIDISNLSSTDLENITKDALQLTQFLQKGGKLSKSDDNLYNYSLDIDNNETPLIKDIKTSKISGDGFKRGQNGPEIQKLNILLSNLGFKVKAGNEDKFTEDTEIFVRKFQIENNILVEKSTGLPNRNKTPGIIDAETLTTMENATKLINPYQISIDDDIELTEYDNVRNRVKEQLAEKGIDVNKALEVGEKLTEVSVKIDRKMNSESLCYTAVKKSLEDGLGIKYQYFGTVTNPETKKKENGAYAKTASYTLLDKSDLFVKLDGFSRKDVQFLPPGAVVVYRPVNSSGHDISSEPGHIGVQSMQVNGLPVVKVVEDNNSMKELLVKKRDNTIETYEVIDGKAVLAKDIQDKSEIEIGKKINGLTIVDYVKEDDNIVGLKLKGISNKKAYYKTLSIEDNKIILEKKSIEHSDISDKMRISPWKSAKIQVYFPVNSLK